MENNNKTKAYVVSFPKPIGAYNFKPNLFISIKEIDRNIIMEILQLR